MGHSNRYTRARLRELLYSCPPPRLSLPTIEPEPTIREYRGDIEADIARIKTIKAADLVIGGLSNPSKMPEYALNLPAKRCHVGARLQAIRGSVCNKCYALSNRYRHPKVVDAMERRYQGIFEEDWVAAMVLTIRKQ